MAPFASLDKVLCRCLGLGGQHCKPIPGMVDWPFRMITDFDIDIEPKVELPVKTEVNCKYISPFFIIFTIVDKPEAFRLNSLERNCSSPLLNVGCEAESIGHCLGRGSGKAIKNRAFGPIRKPDLARRLLR